MTVELCKEAMLLKSWNINLCHTIAQVLSEPLGALYLNVLLGFTARDLMHVGGCPTPIHHLGSWWEVCPQELDEDCCQRAEIFWPINKAHVKK